MSQSSARVRWGILSTGRIAGIFAEGLKKTGTGELVTVASRDLAKAKEFAAKHGGKAYGSYDELLADANVQAVYIAPPHPQHAEWAIRAAEAGKHMICEKPLTMNHGEAMAVAEAARANKVVLMEAFMYRFHPQIARMVELIRSGAIGDVRMIQATFSFQGGDNPESRLLKNELGGGGILDVGCYTLSITRLIAGAALGKPFADPIKITGAAELHPKTGTDMYSAAVATFPNGIIAQLSTGVLLNQENGVRVFGSKGWIHLPSPYLSGLGRSVLIVKREGDKEPVEEAIQSDFNTYGAEADGMAEAIASGKGESPVIPVADTLGNMQALDQWRAAVGLVYESENMEAKHPTFSGRPLKHAKKDSVPKLNVPGLDVPVSRVVFGMDNQLTMPHTVSVLDDFYERGGNAFDTAFIYGGGLQEKLLGRWIELRGLRKDVAVIAKGGHTPFCLPDHITSQLHTSLERLRTPYADMYLMHRDNLGVPVGEFVDVLNEHFRAGRIKAFGGSNWSMARLREANAYAEKKGLQKFTLVSNQLSLAKMMQPVWTGCISAGTDEFRSYLAEGGMTLLAWSSQARGFFTDRAGRDKKSDEELLRCWYSDENFARRERAIELAKKKGVEPINIALAYVLNQKFPVLALIGPRLISETVSTFRGASLTLTPQEISWLENG